jgi:lipopolysaccharide/colanic/teichoic acid biosynthesis glycosyltransferase
MQRVFDILLSGIAILCFLPILLALMLVLRFSGESEVFYRQIRVGRNGRLFGLLKFATMLKNSSNMGAGEITLRNDPRILPVGHFQAE